MHALGLWMYSAGVCAGVWVYVRTLIQQLRLTSVPSITPPPTHTRGECSWILGLIPDTIHIFFRTWSSPTYCGVVRYGIMPSLPRRWELGGGGGAFLQFNRKLSHFAKILFNALILFQEDLCKAFSGNEVFWQWERQVQLHFACLCVFGFMHEKGKAPNTDVHIFLGTVRTTVDWHLVTCDSSTQTSMISKVAIKQSASGKQ